MKAEFNYNSYEWIVTEGKERYKETINAIPTSRVLKGSSDNGYFAEYIGFGTIDNIPVKAIYLLDNEQINYDEDNIDWQHCLDCGRIVIDIDKLTEEQYNNLRKYKEL